MNPSFGLNPPGYVAKKNRTMLKPESTTTTTATSNDPIETYINEIKNHITHYGNVNHRDANGESLMDRYCKIINNVPIEVFQFLVKNGFDFNHDENQIKNDQFALYFALLNFDPQKGSLDTLIYLLTLPNDNRNKQKFSNGQTLLHCACLLSNNLPLSIFKLLIEELQFDQVLFQKTDQILKENNTECNQEHNYHLDNFHNSPLHIVFQSFRRLTHDANILLYLLQYPDLIDVNERNMWGNTVIHCACNNIKNVPLEAFQRLISVCGGDLSLKTDQEYTPLHYAFEAFASTDRCDPGCDDGDKVCSGEVLKYLLVHGVCDGNEVEHCVKVGSMGKCCGDNADDDNHAVPSNKLIHTDKINKNKSKLKQILDSKNVHGRSVFYSSCANISNIPLCVFKYMVDEIGVDIYTVDYDQNMLLNNLIRSINFDSPNNGSNNRQVFVIKYLFEKFGINFGSNDNFEEYSDSHLDSNFFYSDQNLVNFFGHITSLTILHSHQLAMVKYLINHKLLQTSLDGSKYAMHLCRQYDPDPDAIRFIFDEIGIDLTGHNFDQYNRKHVDKNTNQQIPNNNNFFLLALVSPREYKPHLWTLDQINKFNERFDNNTHQLVEFFIEQEMSELLL
jgi:hypothetical protein